MGFDIAYVTDHTGDYRNLAGYWLDGWTVLTHMARHTDRIRIGTLVTNPLLHHPAQLAKQAVAVDHLSGGRLELGIGTGIAGFDHNAVGQDYWPPRERADRFAEYVAIVDGVLRSQGGSFQHTGTYLRSSGTPMSPAPVQQPRPPITVGRPIAHGAAGRRPARRLLEHPRPVRANRRRDRRRDRPAEPAPRRGLRRAGTRPVDPAALTAAVRRPRRLVLG